MLFFKSNCSHFLWYQIHISYYEVQNFSMVLGLYSPLLFFPVHLFNISFSYIFLHDGLLYHYSLGSVNLSILIYEYISGISTSVKSYKARLNPTFLYHWEFPTPTCSAMLVLSPFSLPPSRLMHPSSTKSSLPPRWCIRQAPNSTSLPIEASIKHQILSGKRF